MIETLQKLVPWLPTLPIAAKVPLTVVVAAAAIFFIAIIWSKPSAPPLEVSVQQVQNLLFELSDIQSNYDARWKEIEPLADRVHAIISARFPNQATALQDAKQASQSASDVAQILKTQLLIVRDRLSQERK